jgi:hypothetical protein
MTNKLAKSEATPSAAGVIARFGKKMDAQERGPLGICQSDAF